MFAAAIQVTPEAQYVAAKFLYAEMLEQGYTSVGEFHYLHRQPQGDALEMCEALVRAARETGIALTLLPVLYRQGGFNGAPLKEGQRSFFLELDAYADLVLKLSRRYARDARVRLGLAPHSLRAVTPEDLSWLLELLHDLPDTTPVHVHVAEQEREVQECLEHLKARPVEWLMGNVPLDERWCLIHATHLLEHEVKGIAKADATVSLCPTTEASLGDGFFPFTDYLQHDGRFGIGSDSQVCVSPWEELRLIETVARLQRRQRNLSATEGVSSGERLLSKATATGHVLQRQHGLVVGASADLIALNSQHQLLAGFGAATMLDTLIFAHSEGMIQQVMCGGIWCVKAGKHVRRDDKAGRAFARLRGQLAERLSSLRV
jgi:formimidoylglutamate deiminase